MASLGFEKLNMHSEESYKQFFKNLSISSPHECMIENKPTNRFHTK